MCLSILHILSSSRVACEISIPSDIKSWPADATADFELLASKVREVKAECANCLTHIFYAIHPLHILTLMATLTSGHKINDEHQKLERKRQQNRVAQHKYRKSIL